MLSINTNLSSLIAQSSLKDSTSILNQAVERMTTGYKINHASDNAANYSIATNMTTKINSYMVAEDNVLNGINMLDTANGILDEINDRVQRLHDLQIHASNATYGEESRKAINAEVNALVDEINRLYQTAEHNGIKLFMETEADASGNHYYEQESYADEETTFEQLEIGASSFGVYSQDGTLIQSYNTTDTDTLGDFLTILRNEGFNANINNGEITIKSTNDKYIAGALADELGISTKQTSYVAGTEQNFNNQIPVTTETTTIVTDFTTTTTSTTQTSTIYTTATIETTTTTMTETIVTVYVAQTETLMVPATAVATYAMRSGASPTAETSGFVQEVTRRDTSTMTALSSVDSSVVLPNGTYSISTTEELVQLAEMTNAGLTFTTLGEIVLANDLDLSSIENWAPIGGELGSNSLGLDFDGNGYVISNLTIDRPDGDCIGLFGSVVSIKNLGLENVNIKGKYKVGGLAGEGCYVSNCYVTGNIQGEAYIGGVVGQIYSEWATISSCYVDGIVSGNSDVGGLIGFCSEFLEIEIVDTTVSATVIGNEYSGGMVGYFEADDCGESISITNSQMISGSNDINGVFVGKLSGDGEIKVTITDSTYNSIYDDLGIPLYVGTPKSNSSVTNVTPVVVTPSVTPPVTYTTATLNTTLGELGVSDSTTIYLPNSTVTMSATKTIEEFLEEIRKDSAVTGAELTDGKIIITTENATIDLTSGFFSTFNPTQTESTTPKTITTTQTILVEQVSETPVTETIYTTTTTETSRTETSYTTSTISLSGSTLYGELEPNSTLRVTVISDGTKTFVTLRSDTTFNDFYSDLSSFGITVSESGNTITFTGQGDSYIDSDNLEDLLGLSSVSKTTGQKTSNTDSEKLFAIEKNYGVYAPGQLALQVGTNGNSSSQIEMDVSFKLRGINQLRGIGEDLDTDYLEIIDNILLELTAKQTEFGAVQNRLLSALDEVSIQYENLVSSRSTIRDADIAEVSSTYIQQQILQQAASTLLATANQSPSIALQLI